MTMLSQVHSVVPGEGRLVDLGNVRMRVLAAGEAATSRAFTLTELSGGQGRRRLPPRGREQRGRGHAEH